MHEFFVLALFMLTLAFAGAGGPSNPHHVFSAQAITEF